MSISRRALLKYAAIAGGSMLLPLGLNRIGHAGTAGSPRVKPFTLPFKTPSILNRVHKDDINDYYEITMRKERVEILPGLKTEIWSYNGMAPAPTIIDGKGQQTVVRFINKLDIETSIHLHGMASLPQYDGYANDLIPPEHYKDYDYPNNRAATLWYHDHAVHNTARNVYMGLAGLYIVEDENELRLQQNGILPRGDNREYDVPLLIQDKTFRSDGSLLFDDQGHKSQMGDTILVNGVPWPRMEVERRKYRFRVCNGSVSRSYRLGLSNGDDFMIIGTDAGLMNNPVWVKNFRLGMAERYEFVIDFSKYPLGSQIVLRNLGLPNNINYDGTNQLMRFDVVKQATTTDTQPLTPTTQLANPQVPSISDVLAKVKRSREFRYERSNGMWTISGKTWEPDKIDAAPEYLDYEMWTLHNPSGGWFHPIHIHLADFLIVERNGKPAFPYERGWKDVFYLGENETVRVVGKFGPNTGKYMTHCHNTVHEDHDMMRQFEVVQTKPLNLGDPPPNIGKNPITAAPAQPLPAPPFS